MLIAGAMAFAQIHSAMPLEDHELSAEPFTR